MGIIDQLTNWIKDVLVGGITDNLSGMLDAVNRQVGDISGQVGMTPADFEPEVFSMIRTISETVILPIAGMILTFIACCELIQMIIDHNNLASFETWTLFKWVFKTSAAVLIISNTFNIAMAVFDLAQYVIAGSAGLIQQDTQINSQVLLSMQDQVEAMEVPQLLGLFFQTMIVHICMMAMSVVIFVIVYGRMIEIYMVTSLAPIPFSTFGSREQSHTGQNYLRSLFALGFQGFLIMICVAIYAVMIKGIALSDDIVASIWKLMGYTVLLCLTLIKTGSLAKSIFAVH